MKTDGGSWQYFRALVLTASASDCSSIHSTFMRNVKSMKTVAVWVSPLKARPQQAFQTGRRKRETMDGLFLKRWEVRNYKLVLYSVLSLTQGEHSKITIGNTYCARTVVHYLTDRKKITADLPKCILNCSPFLCCFNLWPLTISC